MTGPASVAMNQQLRSGLDELNDETDSLHLEHSDRKQALIADIRAKEDTLRKWFDAGLRRIDRKRNKLILQVSSATYTSAHLSDCGTPASELEAVTSSTPADTGHLLRHAPHRLAQHHQSEQSDLACVPDQRSEPHTTHHSLSEPEPAASRGNNEASGSEAMQTVVVADVHEAPDNFPPSQQPSAGIASWHSPANNTDQQSHQDQPAEDIEIDVSHVIPVAEQRAAGTTTYMFCRPHSRRGKSSLAKQQLDIAHTILGLVNAAVVCPCADLQQQVKCALQADCTALGLINCGSTSRLTLSSQCQCQ